MEIDQKHKSYLLRFNPEAFSEPRDVFYNFIPLWEKSIDKMRNCINAAQVEILITDFYPTDKSIQN